MYMYIVMGSDKYIVIDLEMKFYIHMCNNFDL